MALIFSTALPAQDDVQRTLHMQQTGAEWAKIAPKTGNHEKHVAWRCSCLTMPSACMRADKQNSHSVMHMQKPAPSAMCLAMRRACMQAAPTFPGAKPPKREAAIWEVLACVNQAPPSVKHCLGIVHCGKCIETSFSLKLAALL